MVETALLVATIGITGTLTASILTVLSQPWRTKKEREQDKENLRRALYAELARIVVTIQIQLSEAADIERKLEEAVKARSHDSESAERPPNELLDSSGLRKEIDTKLLSATRLLGLGRAGAEDLVGGLNDTILRDAKMAILYHTLPEADVANGVYTWLRHYVTLNNALDKATEDPKERWRVHFLMLDKVREALILGSETGHLDISLLERYCYLPSKIESLDTLLAKPPLPVLEECLKKS